MSLISLNTGSRPSYDVQGKFMDEHHGAYDDHRTLLDKSNKDFLIEAIIGPLHS